MSTQHIFVDYEGTLCESSVCSGVFSDLLFDDAFTNLKPNNKVKKYLSEQSNAQIYVLGVVDTGREVKQKERWLKKYYPMIPEENYIFVSSEHQKVDVIDAFVERFGWDKSKVLLIDDKEKHLVPVRKAGYRGVNANDL